MWMLHHKCSQQFHTKQNMKINIKPLLSITIMSLNILHWTWTHMSVIILLAGSTLNPITIPLRLSLSGGMLQMLSVTWLYQSHRKIMFLDVLFIDITPSNVVSVCSFVCFTLHEFKLKPLHVSNAKLAQW